MIKVITIDGRAGSGKSTVARKLAKKLSFVHLNSGALFRAVALKATQERLNLEDDDSVATLAEKMDFRFSLNEASDTVFFVDGRASGTELFTAEVGKSASNVALLPKLREALVVVQREIAEHSPVVVEGRDSGTHVFPNAPLKFFLDAALDIRARRRFAELKMRGEISENDFQRLKDEIATRDAQDENRMYVPSKKADDAILIDTGEMTADEVVLRLAEYVGSAERI